MTQPNDPKPGDPDYKLTPENFEGRVAKPCTCWKPSETHDIDCPRHGHTQSKAFHTPPRPLSASAPALAAKWHHES